MIRLAAGTRVLACRVFEPELAALGVPAGRVLYLDQGLHRYPDDLRAEVGAALRRLEDDPAVDRVVLAYGFCGGGLEGLCSRRVSLVAPRCHDCIPLLLGREPRGSDREGSFYLSPGWIEHGKTPLTEHALTAEKFGEEEALWVGRQLLRNYREVVLLRTAAGLGQEHRDYARRMAGLFGLAFREQGADPGRLARLLTGRHGDEAEVLPPGRPLRGEHFSRPESGEVAPCP